MNQSGDEKIGYGEANAMLVRMVKNGSREAAEKLIKANDGLIRKHLNEVREKHMLSHMYSYDDALQDCRLALLSAAESYDPAKGAFTTYAKWKMFAAVSDGWDRSLPAYVPEGRLKLMRAGRLDAADAARIEAFRGCPDVDEVMRTEEAAGVYDEILYGETVPEPDPAGPQEVAELRELRETLLKAVSALGDPREAFVLMRYYSMGGDEPETLEQVGRKLGLSRDRVKQIRDHALRKLRHPSMCRLLAEWAHGYEFPGWARSHPDREIEDGYRRLAKIKDEAEAEWEGDGTNALRERECEACGRRFVPGEAWRTRCGRCVSGRKEPRR